VDLQRSIGYFEGAQPWNYYNFRNFSPQKPYWKKNQEYFEKKIIFLSHKFILRLVLRRKKSYSLHKRTLKVII